MVWQWMQMAITRGFFLHLFPVEARQNLHIQVLQVRAVNSHHVLPVEIHKGWMIIVWEQMMAIALGSLHLQGSQSEATL